MKTLMLATAMLITLSFAASAQQTRKECQNYHDQVSCEADSRCVWEPKPNGEMWCRKK